MDHKTICVLLSENSLSFLISINVAAVCFRLVYSKNVRVCVYKRMLRLIALLNPPIWSVNTQSGLIIAGRSQTQEAAKGNLYL